MNTEKFFRLCPSCNTQIFHARKKERNFREKRKILCRACANKKRCETYNLHPKEEFTCYTCKTKFMEWASQMHNVEHPFCSKQCWLNSDIKSLVGQRFGRLLVLERKRKNNTTYYKCQCDCGNTTITSHANLFSNSCKSCGCLQKELLVQRSTKPIDQVVATAVYNYTKRNAKLRSIDWFITKEDVHSLIYKPCFYCSNPGSNITKTSGGNKTTNNNGIDRKDNKLPYVLDNCVPCCKRCNQAKNDMTFIEFKTWATRLVNQLSAM